MAPGSQCYNIFETAGGFCGIAWNDAGITRFQLPMRGAAATEHALRRRVPAAVAAPPPEAISRVINAAIRYYAGEAIDFSAVAVDLGEQSEFFRQIYAAVRRIGWGQATTYGAVAKALGGGPGTARDVGQAMARNPVPLIIPCHRVLAAGGKIGGFSAPGGTEAKQHMLTLEGVNAAPAESQLSFRF